MCFARKVILIDPGRNSAERRCSLAHAIAHIDLGHALCHPGSRAEVREEAQADLMAARRLIQLDHLIDAIVWSHGTAEAAEVLCVDMETLRTRGAHVHPSERDALSAALAAREDHA